MGGNHRVSIWHGIPRDQLCWWPVTITCKCDGCGLCVTSCPVEALAFDHSLGIPFVNHVHRCIVGCTTCATVCPKEAIILPGRDAIQQVIAERGLAERARKELRLYRKRYEGVLLLPYVPRDPDDIQDLGRLN